MSPEDKNLIFLVRERLHATLKQRGETQLNSFAIGGQRDSLDSMLTKFKNFFLKQYEWKKSNEN